MVHASAFASFQGPAP